VLALSLAVFGVLLGVMVIYQRKTATATDVQNPDIKVEAPAKAITIAAPKQEKVSVKPGEQQLKIAQKQSAAPTVPLEAPAQGKATPIAAPKQEKVSAQPGEQQLKIAPTQAAAPTVSRKSSGYKLLVPAYFYPEDQGWLEWERLFDSPGREMLLAILNPNSGPGEQPDPNYDKVVTRASAAGLALIGYVDADHGNRPVSKIKEDIDRYSRFYPSIQGIFLDGQATSPAEVAHCAEVCEYARKNPNFRLIIANPGTVRAREYFSRTALDAACLFDDPWRESSLALPPWTDKYADRIAMVVHDVRTAAHMRGLVQKAARKKMGLLPDHRSRRRQSVGPIAVLLGRRGRRCATTE
jgi:Spherulation-specific family 4